jgi:hypothetical protein
MAKRKRRAFTTEFKAEARRRPIRIRATRRERRIRGRASRPTLWLGPTCTVARETYCDAVRRGTPKFLS